jgi:hypothetical protein
MTSDLETTNTTLLKTAVTMSAVSLFLSGWAFLSSFDDGDFERDTEQRLACLELPGPNDCGADGR